jgi:hypothetical protein
MEFRDYELTINSDRVGRGERPRVAVPESPPANIRHVMLASLEFELGRNGPLPGYRGPNRAEPRMLGPFCLTGHESQSNEVLTCQENDVHGM